MNSDYRATYICRCVKLLTESWPVIMTYNFSILFSHWCLLAVLTERCAVLVV